MTRREEKSAVKKKKSGSEAEESGQASTDKAYKSSVKRGLKFKDGKLPKGIKKNKNKKKSKKRKKISKIDDSSESPINEDSTIVEIETGNLHDTTKEFKAFKSDYEKSLDGLTEAERAFLERQKVNEDHFIRQQTKKTHRQKIEAYNAKLADMSEHYDIPKVGPG